MQQTHHHVRQRLAQVGMGLGGIGQIQRLALFDQRAHPIHLPPLLQLSANARHHLIAPVVRHHFGHDRRATGGQLIDHRHIQIGVIAHGQRARNGCRRHHQHVRLHALCLHLAAQGQALRHTKAVLLVNHGQRQIFELDVLLNDRVCAHHQRGLARLDQRQHGGAFFLLLTADQPSHLHAQRLQPAHQLGKVLSGQNLGGRHQGALPACIDGHHGRQRGHHGFACAYISLQQAVHGHWAGQVFGYFLTHTLLGVRQPKRQCSQQLTMQTLGLQLQGRGPQQIAFALGGELRQLLRQQLLTLQANPGRVAAVFQGR